MKATRKYDDRCVAKALLFTLSEQINSVWWWVDTALEYYGALELSITNIRHILWMFPLTESALKEKSPITNIFFSRDSEFSWFCVPFEEKELIGEYMCVRG